MAGRHDGLEQQGMAVGVERPQARHVLGGLPVHDLAVVERRLDQHRGIAPRGQVGVRAVRLHVGVLGEDLGVAPLLELADRQRQRLVEHRVDHVHERHAHHGGPEQLGPHVEHGADEQAAGAAALDDEPVGGGVAAGDQVLGARDEVGERVALLEHAAGIVPALAEVAAAADVGDGEGHAALEQAQPARREHDRVRKAVRAVAREQERARAVARCRRGRDERDGHARAVGRGGVDALGPVTRGLVAAEHLRLLEERQRPRGHVVIEHRGRRDQRLIAEAVARRHELGVRLGIHLVRGLGELHEVRDAGGDLGHAQASEPVVTLLGDVVAGEDVDVLDHHVLAVRDELGPVLGPWIGDRRADETEVAAALAVGPDVEDAVPGPDAVIDVVLVVLLPLEHRPPPASRICRRHVANLGAGERARRGEEPGAAARAPHVDAEELVGFFEDQVVAGVAQAVTPETVRPLRRVLADVEQRTRPRRPRHRRDLLDTIGLQLARRQVLHEQRVLAKAGVVERVGEPVGVVVDGISAEGEEGMAHGQGVEIEQDLLGLIRPGGLAAVDRILLALLRARVIEVIAATVGNGRVVFLDAAQDLPVERVLERFHRLHHGRRVRVLRFQVSGDTRIVLVAQPEVIVLAAVAVNDVEPGNLGCVRRDGHGGPMVP